MLRNWLVCGIEDSRIQRRLLAESNLTLMKAYDWPWNWLTVMHMTCRHRTRSLGEKGSVRSVASRRQTAATVGSGATSPVCVRAKPRRRSRDDQTCHVHRRARPSRHTCLLKRRTTPIAKHQPTHNSMRPAARPNPWSLPSVLMMLSSVRK
jgi:hypothetical protein